MDERLEVYGEKATWRKPGEKLESLSRDRRKFEKIYRKGVEIALLMD